MATRIAGAKSVKEFVYEWEGKDRNGKIVRGDTRASGENQVQATLRRQGIFVTKIKKRRMRAGVCCRRREQCVRKAGKPAKNRPARAKSGSKATPGRRHDAAIRAAERVVQTFPR